MKNSVLIVVIVLAVAAGIFIWKYKIPSSSNPANTSPSEVACSQDAKICPDGSSVSRVAPACQFAVCPGSTNNLVSFTDPNSGISFKFPQKLATTYIRTQDWPPQPAAYDEPFTCQQGGSEVAGQGGQTKVQTINGRTYCVNKESEGAAGTTYTTYNYGTEIKSQMVFLTFTLAFPQCLNYTQPQQDACLNENKSFDTDFDSIVDKIFSTIQTSGQ